MALTSAEIQQVLDAIAALGKKIDALPTATNLNGVTWLELLQDGVSKKVAPDTIASSGTYTPTVSDESNLTASVTDVMYTKIGNNVSISGKLNVTLDGGANNGTFKFDLTSSIQPNNDWDGNELLSAVLHRTNDVFTAECSSYGDIGSKLIYVVINDTTAGATVKIDFIINYSVNN